VRTSTFVLSSFVVAACGGEDPLPCDYREAGDATNNTTAETSGVTIGTGTKTVCGKIEPGHFDAAQKSVDVDAFRVTAAADTSLIMQFFGDDGLASLTELSVVVRDTKALPAILAAGTFHAALADHAAFLVELPAGDYDVSIAGSAPADIAAALEYKIRFVEDKPDRCAPVTAAASYTEALDNADNAGNDVIAADFSKDPQFTLTAGTTDAPEPTGLTVDAKSALRVTGSSAMVNPTDQYMDRDTFEITTGGSTDELTIRMDWMGAADLDYAVFEEQSTTPTGLSNISANGTNERSTFAVKPSTKYWVWVGSFDGGAPTTYDLSICGGRLPP
jgi:hypothetical protein